MAGLDWIAVDWGTSALRVWALDAKGRVLDRVSSPEGMGTLSGPDAYEDALLRLADGWLDGREKPVPVIVCGMAGARQGWKEAAYRKAPCRPASGTGLTAVSTRDRRIAVKIVPGICQDDPADVMRGEETQLAGLVSAIGVSDGIVCMPGTHSKWVRLAGGRVTAFSTVMTGEMFALMAGHSVLRHSAAGDGHDEAAFAAAVREMIAAPETLTAALFSVRAMALLDEASPAVCRARLSGLLIGAELAAMRDYRKTGKVHVVGAGPLVARYAQAMDIAGAQAVPEDGEALTLAGLTAVRAALGGGEG
ncbi:2-dehydro-3-deoxygalactonokinase [Zhengella sp. ZM62]|uniref:2-dehydro-3-deoxygalactonokinase n=1 Tax=Zhengella sedimenti TaxID=3390035 RepID=UPI003974EEA2